MTRKTTSERYKSYLILESRKSSWRQEAIPEC
jgi:hypothetical protein